MSNFEHLAAALRLPDPAFEEFWAHYLRARPDFVEGVKMELTRRQLMQLQKIAFLAGREAALAELFPGDCPKPTPHVEKQ